MNLIRSAKSKIRTTLNEKEIFRSYKLIKLNEEDPFKLLESNRISDLLISILTNIAQEQMDDYLSLLTKKVKTILTDEDKISKFVNQLLVLTRLRNFDKTVIAKFRNMPITLDIKKDFLYLEGKEEGREKGREEGREKGREEGREEGVTKHEMLVLKNCIKNKYALKDIAIILGISTQKVSALIRKYKLQR